MRTTSKPFDLYLQKTRFVYMWTKILNTPFWSLYTLLPFILCKDLQATAWQIACIISLKPIVSFFSLYWSARIKSRRDRLIPNIVWAGILSHFPFLFVPFVDHPWFFVFASAFYMFFHRGVNPAWMEILKINIPQESQKSVFIYGSVAYYVGGAFLAIAMGGILDSYDQAWKWMFPLTVFIAYGGIFFQKILPIKKGIQLEGVVVTQFSFKEKFKKPWKDAWTLMQKRPDFARFQVGFMLGGGGLMLWQPALPAFFFDVLNLNYKELTFAITLCKSFGYSFFLPLWTRAMNRLDLFAFSGIVTAIAALFPIGLMLAQSNLYWLYLAYFLYGTMQGGSELSWNLSGPIFSKHEDSSTYTGVNVCSVGLRGFIAPVLGSLICSWTNPTTVLLLGGVICLLATWQMFYNRIKENKVYFLNSPSNI